MSELVFGRIISAAEIEQAATMNLKKWLDTYLREVERQAGFDVGSLPAVRSYNTLPELEHWPEDQLPGITIVSTGTVGDPYIEGDGKYIAEWELGVAIVTSAKTQKATNDTAKLYGGAIRAVMLQKSGLGGLARDVSWLEESTDDLPPEDTRTLAICLEVFAVQVPDVVTRRTGPSVPDPNPADWPTITTPVPATVEEMT